jgi:hypothetical protein
MFTNIIVVELTKYMTKFPHACTEVVVSGFDPAWMEGLNAAKIAAEIEMHFDRLLARPGLSITVRDSLSGKSFECRPFDYEAVPGTSIKDQLEVTRVAH